jgi:AraC-like DNA-binding protein
MGESERMLLFEDVSVKEIAQKNGYSNLQHFYAAFKKFTGYTPMEFKQLYKIEPPSKS